MPQQFLGKYRGTVKVVDDPQKRGRIRADCPQALPGGQLLNWALPNFPPNHFDLPAVGDLVWIEFEEGNIDAPIWTGVFYTSEQFLSKFGLSSYDPQVSSKVTPKGITEKTTGDVNITASGNFNTHTGGINNLD